MIRGHDLLSAGGSIAYLTPMPLDRTRRDVLLLAASQALYMTSIGATFIVIALVGNVLADDKSLSTLPVALHFAAAMVTTMPASFYMKRVGRQLGFITGAAVAAVGAVICAWAIFEGSFLLFCAGTALVGTFNAFAQYLRFAAADAADPAFRARAISMVIAGGVVAAVTGPYLARLTKDWFAPVEYAGAYVSLAVIFLLIIALMLFVRIPRLTLAERREGGRPLRQIACRPEFLVAALAATAAYATMMLLMTVAPLAMTACGLTFSDSAWMMLVHMLGMFGPSFVTGHLIKRYGVLDVMLVGALLFVATLAVDLAGVESFHFLVGMALLGTGWNFLFIGGTTLLTQTHTPAEGAKVQGFNDFLIWTSVTLAVLLSGVLQTGLGWTFVNLGVVPVVALALGLTLWLRLGGRELRPAG
jgi:predicted MFS family arabinose efflux permease